MKVLIVGSGGREYSLGLAFSKDKKVTELFFAPGNGMSSSLGTNIDISTNEDILTFAKNNNIDLTVVGPEKPLVEGIVDMFKNEKMKIFGPTKNVAKLEGSKNFMKNFLKKYSIPTSQFITTDDLESATKFINSLTLPIVIKADGLCSGKGTVIAQTYKDAINTTKNMLNGESFGDAGKIVVIEEYLKGYELSISVICDGTDYKILPIAKDYKRLEDDNRGVNTGGMGAYSPINIEQKLLNKIEDNIINPTLKGINNEYEPYTGILYIGIMVVDDKPYVLEYNVRFGDPECEVILPLIKSSIFSLINAASINDLKNIELEINKKVAVGVVVASKKYPASVATSEIIVIKEIPNELKNNGHIIYAGVKIKNNTLYANNGRVYISVGIGDTINIAKKNSYEIINFIQFNGMKYRSDIAKGILNE